MNSQLTTVYFIPQIEQILKQQLKWKFLPLNVVNDQLVTFLFPVNVFQPKFAAAGLPPNL